MSGMKKARKHRQQVQGQQTGQFVLFANSKQRNHVSKARNQSSQAAYGTLAGNLIALDNLGAIPCGINLSRLDEGCGIAKH